MIFLPAVPFIGAEEPGMNYKLQEQVKPDLLSQSIEGPGKDIVVETYQRVGGTEGPAFKIVLSSLVNPAQKELLLGYDRGAQALLSPDGRWIVVNDRPMRGQCAPKLFKQKKGLTFVEVKTSDLRDKAIKYFVARNKLSDEIKASMTGEGDCFVEAQQWAVDSGALLIRVSKQRTGEPIWIWEWHCVYDLKTEAMTLDLNAMNHGSYNLRKVK